MPDELRHSQQHATMSSLKATHVAHRIAAEIDSTPTVALDEVKVTPQQQMPAMPAGEYWKQHGFEPTVLPAPVQMTWLSLGILLAVFFSIGLITGMILVSKP